MYTNELYHHGILGQKWGVRRFQNPDGSLTAEGKQRYGDYKSDRKAIKAATRHVAAEGNILRKRARAYDQAGLYQRKAERQYDRASRGLATPWNRKARDERKNNALLVLDAANRRMDLARREVQSAKSIYEQDSEQLRKMVNAMVKKYGPESVKEIRMRPATKLGKNVVADMMKTGFTFANAPIFGKAYSGSYMRRREVK